MDTVGAGTSRQLPREVFWEEQSMNQPLSCREWDKTRAWGQGEPCQASPYRQSSHSITLQSGSK